MQSQELSTPKEPYLRQARWVQPLETHTRVYPRLDREVPACRLNKKNLLRKDAMLDGQYYIKPPASRFITHGSQANAGTIPVVCCMPSPASCAEAVHKGHFHSRIDFSSQYEQIPYSPNTSLVHTIGFDNRQYAPLSAPQGSHHSPVQGQNFSN